MSHLNAFFVFRKKFLKQKVLDCSPCELRTNAMERNPKRQ